MNTKVFININEIEYEFNYEFKDEFKVLYGEDIIKIFNGIEYNSENSDINIIIAMYKLTRNNRVEAIEILEKEHKNGSILATCYLGIIYNSFECNQEMGIMYMKIAADQGHIPSSANLATIYVNTGNMEEFLKYNMIALNTNYKTAIINMGVYYHILNDTDMSLKYFQQAFEMNSSEAYYVYSKIQKVLTDKIKYCMMALKLKLKQQYIVYLTTITNPIQRYILCNEYMIDIDKYSKYDNMIINFKYNSMRYNTCPICMKTTDLIKFKCHHSICMDCIKYDCSICIVNC